MKIGVGRRSLLTAAVCVTLTLVVYTTTMAPSLTWMHHGADGGDLVRAVVTGSLPHPPGFPTYLILGKVFIRLPWEDPAWRMNLLSAVAASGAIGLSILALARILEQPRVLVLAVSGLLLSLAPLLWSQALITEVYALSAFWSALLVLGATFQEIPPWVIGLAIGIGLGVHPTLIFLAPLAVWKVCRAGKAELARLVALSAAILLGWGIMYGVVLFVLARTRSPWADLGSFNGWWNMVSARLYRGYIFGLPMSAWQRRLLALGGILARQFTPIGVLASILGVRHLWAIRRGLALGSLVGGAGCVLYSFGYNTTDSLVYLVTVLPVATVWLGVGLNVVIEKLNRWHASLRWLLVFLPLIQGAVFWNRMDVSDDHNALAWAEKVLEEAPDCAILVTDQDAHTFGLWYVHDVLERRTDTYVLDQDMLGYGPYRRTIEEKWKLDDTSILDHPADLAGALRCPLVYADEVMGKDDG